MITNYEFIDVNSAGEKERKLTATTELYNKLSAYETNNIRTKLNELVTAVNLQSVPLYGEFKLLYKASGNLNQNAIEVGDIVGGFLGNYHYIGGDVTLESSYEKFFNVSISSFRFVGAGQTYTLPAGCTALKAWVNDAVQHLEETGYESDLNTFTQLGAVVTFKKTITAGQRIYIDYYF